MFRLFSITLAVTVIVLAGGPASAHEISAQDRELTALVFQAVDLKKGKVARANISKVSHPLLRKTLYWFLYTEAPAAEHWTQMASFLTENPHWPKLWTIRRNIEEAMSVDTSSEQMEPWFAEHPPVSARGNGLLASWLLREDRTDEAIGLVRQTWVNGNFSRADEKWFYRSFRKYLTKSDHEERLDRLLWEGENWSVRRMFPRVDSELRKLAEARYLLRHMRGNVDAAIERVPEHYKEHVGLIYERLRWRRRKGKDKSARSLLDDSLGDVPYPELWFKEREILARRALSQGLISVAYGLVSEHGVTTADVAAYSSAEWLSGWIALQFLHEPEWALRHFTAMHGVVRYPISVARGSYWAGRAALAMGQPELAREWLDKAVMHPTTFYGQLATAHIPDFQEPVDLADFSGEFEVENLDGNELVQVLHVLAEVDAQERMRPFLQHLIDAETDNVGWQVAVGQLAQSVGRPDFGIRVAKAATHLGLVLTELGYPMVELPSLPQKKVTLAPEAALVYSIVRQESSYYAAAKSVAGARGLMQLMPATAKLTAKSVGLTYSRARLTSNTSYNLQLGQAYLSSVLKSFDGSYVLALAAYNAGPRRAKAWIKANGDPRHEDVDVVDWIELIPFSETRNYVQRVMESLQMYRARNDVPIVVTQLSQDLMR